MHSLKNLIRLARDGSYSSGDKLIITYHPILGWTVSGPGRETQNTMDLEETLALFIQK